MTSLSITRLSVLVVAMAALIGCSSGVPATLRPGATVAPPSAAPATPAGGPSSADGLCGAFPANLAFAALGIAVDEPDGGELIPRPNGIYCRYSATGDPNTNVEAQLRDMTRAELEALAHDMGATTPVPGVGEVAFARSSSTLGISGAAVAAWSGGRGVTVNINHDGNQAQMQAAAQAIAAAVLLAASP